MGLNGLKGQPSTGSQGSPLATKRVRSEARMKDKRGDQEDEDPPQVRLFQNNETPIGLIREKRV
jgi:hypothetical protein